MTRSENGIDSARDSKKPAATAGLWRRTGILAGGVLVFGGLYFFVRQYFKDGVWSFDLYLLNKSLAVTSLLLVSLSMLLTGWSYFRPGSTRVLAYRKFYGLAGFWIGLAHGAVSHILLPGHFPFPSWGLKNPAASSLGLAALLLFGAMAAASDRRVKGHWGGATWRKFLRYAGYAALIAAAVHAGVLKWASWTKYIRTFESVLPSLSLPVVLVSTAALVLRLAVWTAERRRGR
jgi:hypothetical protein